MVILWMTILCKRILNNNFMNLNNLLPFLKKQDDLLYPLCINQAIVVENAAKLLVDLLKSDVYEERNELCKQIKACESQGDTIAVQIFETLYKVKRTTFSKVDMQELVSLVESFLDLIHDCSKKLVIYHPKHIDHVWVEIGESIQEDAKIITGIIKELSHAQEKAKFLMQKCHTIKDIEHEVDDLYECYMSNLFEVEKDAIEITKNKNIIETLEDTTDKAKEIADCIKTIIVKLV